MIDDYPLFKPSEAEIDAEVREGERLIAEGELALRGFVGSSTMPPPHDLECTAEETKHWRQVYAREKANKTPHGLASHRADQAIKAKRVPDGNQQAD